MEHESKAVPLVAVAGVAIAQHMTTDGTDQAIVRSTVDMAHSLGMRVVAEGVEDRVTWNLLAALKCDIARATISLAQCLLRNLSAG